MESQEQSTTSKDLEKDVTLNSEPAQEQNTGSVNNQPEASSAAAEQAQEVVNPGASQAAAASTPAEETVQAEPEEKQPASVETEAQPQHKYAAMSKTELIAALESLKEQPIDSVKDDVAQIKSAFFAIRKEEIAKEKDIKELFDLQLRAFESEAEMIGSRNVPALMESLEENREDFRNWTVLVKRNDEGRIIEKKAIISRSAASWLHRNTGTAVLRSV